MFDEKRGDEDAGCVVSQRQNGRAAIEVDRNRDRAVRITNFSSRPKRKPLIIELLLHICCAALSPASREELIICALAVAQLSRPRAGRCFWRAKMAWSMKEEKTTGKRAKRAH